MPFIFIIGPCVGTPPASGIIAGSEDRGSTIGRAILPGGDLSCKCPGTIPTWIPRSSAADRSASHFSRERTKGTPSPWRVERRALAQLSGRTICATVDVPGIPRARQKKASRELGRPLKGSRIVGATVDPCQ